MLPRYTAVVHRDRCYRRLPPGPASPLARDRSLALQQGVITNYWPARILSVPAAGRTADVQWLVAPAAALLTARPAAVVISAEVLARNTLKICSPHPGSRDADGCQRAVIVSLCWQSLVRHDPHRQPVHQPVAPRPVLPFTSVTGRAGFAAEAVVHLRRPWDDDDERDGTDQVWLRDKASDEAAMRNRSAEVMARRRNK